MRALGQARPPAVGGAAAARPAGSRSQCGQPAPARGAEAGRAAASFSAALGGAPSPSGAGDSVCRVARSGRHASGRRLRLRTGQILASPQQTGSRYRPPQRDTGIALEKDMAIELRDDAANGVNDDGSTWWRRSGEDRGEGGYRCRWTVMGGAARDGTWEYKETWWEKADWSGFKELGAEKSGFNAEGDTWWETWREVLRPDGPSLEKSADKWARNAEGWEWNEKWWERYTAAGAVEKGADKSGRQEKQAWWEKWGERYDTRAGSVSKWTDKWAESGAGIRWGDKWEERFENNGKGSRQGETWRISSSGERWSRTWGETHAADGVVRKFGRSTSGEEWNTASQVDPRYAWEQPQTWQGVLDASQQLLAIETPARPEGLA